MTYAKSKKQTRKLHRFLQHSFSPKGWPPDIPKTKEYTKPRAEKGIWRKAWVKPKKAGANSLAGVPKGQLEQIRKASLKVGRPEGADERARRSNMFEARKAKGETLKHSLELTDPYDREVCCSSLDGFTAKGQNNVKMCLFLSRFICQGLWLVLKSESCRLVEKMFSIFFN